MVMELPYVGSSPTTIKIRLRYANPDSYNRAGLLSVCKLSGMDIKWL